MIYEMRSRDYALTQEMNNLIMLVIQLSERMNVYPSTSYYPAPPPQNNGVGHALYSGAADVGKAKTYIGAAIGSFVGLVLLIAGVILLLQPPSKYTSPATATVTAVSSCTQLAGDSPAQYDCSMTVQYTYNTTSYTEPLEITSGKTYAINDTVDILIYPADPTQMSGTTGISSMLLGGILIGAALLVVLVSWVTAYLAHRSKAFAALEGASVGVSAVRGMFGR